MSTQPISWNQQTDTIDNFSDFHKQVIYKGYLESSSIDGNNGTEAFLRINHDNTTTTFRVKKDTHGNLQFKVAGFFGKAVSTAFSRKLSESYTVSKLSTYSQSEVRFLLIESGASPSVNERTPLILSGEISHFDETDNMAAEGIGHGLKVMGVFAAIGFCLCLPCLCPVLTYNTVKDIELFKPKNST
ncbi:MAG: hypothetical protein HAW66_09275 [Shewanella sp.]|nr:hypothetical protein [Shewanella sp.]